MPGGDWAENGLARLLLLIGSIDEADRSGLHGWVRDPAFPDQPVSLLITANGQFLDRVVANQHRPDVEQAGFGTGRFGFAVAFNPPLLPSESWNIHVCSETDGEDLPGSPVRITASTEFDAVAKAAFAAAIGNVSADDELDQRIEFLAAQRERLVQMRADRQSGRAERDRRWARLAPPSKPRRRALVLDEHRLPEPDRDGGSAALVSHMRSLARLGYEVTFAAPQMADGASAALLRQEGILVCHAPWFGSIEEVLRRQESSYDLAYLHRVATVTAYGALVRRYQPRARLIYSVADLHHLRLARQAVVEQQPGLMAQARRIKAQEVWAAEMAEAVITHSSVEAALLRLAAPAASVHVMAWDVPTRLHPAGFAGRQGMAFIGNFSHAPNVAAALQLVQRLLPAVHATTPGIVCKLVGSDLPAALRLPQPGVEVVGHVAMLSTVLDTVRLTVAPLPYGAGLKAKVIGSLAAGVPCVCSPAAAEGLDLPGRLADLVAVDQQAAVALIVRLHEDEAYHTDMSHLALAFARATFSTERLDDAMREAAGLVAVSSDAKHL